MVLRHLQQPDDELGRALGRQRAEPRRDLKLALGLWAASDGGGGRELSQQQQQQQQDTAGDHRQLEKYHRAHRVCALPFRGTLEKMRRQVLLRSPAWSSP